MSLSKSVLSYISEANKGLKLALDPNSNLSNASKIKIIKNAIENGKQLAGYKNHNDNFGFLNTISFPLKDKQREIAKKILHPDPSSDSDSSSFWSKASNHISNHKVGYGVGAGAVTAAGIGAAALHHRNKNKGILNKIKNNPGKAAGASLAALGAGAGAAALIRYLRKKRKNG